MSKLYGKTVVESKKPTTPDSTLTEGYLAIVFLREGCVMTQRETNKYSHIVRLDVKTGAICYHPEQLKKSLKSTYSTETRTYESLRDLDDDESFSLWESKKLDLSSWVKQTVMTLVPVENIQWSVKVNGVLSLVRYYDSVTDSISDFVNDCMENKRLVPLVSVEVMQKLPLHEYIAQSKFPSLEGWIKENEDWMKESGKHIDFEGFSNLLQCSKYLKSVIVEKEDKDNSCSICVEKLIKSSQAIQTPCSHVFHGSCILQWLGINSACPLCRFDLSEGSGEKKQEEVTPKKHASSTKIVR